MGNNNMSPLGPNKKKRVRFNLYWMYAIIALLLFGLYYANDPSMSKEVNWSEFEKIAKEGGMTNVTVHAKKDYVEAQLNDSTAKAIFKTDKITGKPIVYTNIPSGDSFATTLEAWKKDYGFNADVNYENSSDLTNILWTFGPIVFFIIFWFLQPKIFNLFLLSILISRIRIFFDIITKKVISCFSRKTK